MDFELPSASSNGTPPIKPATKIRPAAKTAKTPPVEVSATPTKKNPYRTKRNVVLDPNRSPAILLDIMLGKQTDAQLQELASLLTQNGLFERLKPYKIANQNVLLLGPPGIGKSDTIKQVSDWAGDTWYYDMRLSLYDPSQVGGLPYVVDIPDENGVVIDGKIKYDHPVWLPPVGFNGIGTAVFDEINTAPIATQNAALQCFQAPNGTQRMIGSHPIPNGIWMPAAGNRAEDIAHVHTMGEPLRGRFQIINIERPDVKAWTTWAYNNNINKWVVAFLNHQEKYLFQKAANEYEPPTTPRAWAQKASWLADMGCEDSRAYAGAIGTGVAGQFTAYLKELRYMPNMKDLLDGKVTWDWTDKSKFGISYGILSELVYQVRNNSKLFDKAMKIVAQARPEHAVIFVLGVLDAEDPKLVATAIASPELRTWTNAHKSLWQRIRNMKRKK